MTTTGRENDKTSPNCVARDITVQKISSKEKEEKEAHSAHAPYHRTVEAMAGPVCQGCQKAGQKVWPDRQRGQRSQCVCQRQDQRNDQRAQLQHVR
eukprot:15055622-Ditylum_brightwellii.AAC.1